MTQIQFHSSAINASECIRNGWDLLQRNLGLYLGTSIVALLIVTCVPCVNIFINGPIMCGVFYIFLRGMRDEPVEFADLFKGFDNFVPAMIVGLIQLIPEIIGQGVRFTADIADFGLRQGGNGDYYQGDETRTALAGGVLIIAIIVGVVVFFGGIALRLALFFALPLITEHKLGAGEAMKLSARAARANLGGLIVLFLLEMLVALAGMIALCIGLLVAIPVIFAANAFAYRQVFPLLNTEFQNAPPAPDAYGSTYGIGR